MFFSKHISRGLKNPSNKILIITYIENCKKWLEDVLLIKIIIIIKKWIL